MTFSNGLSPTAVKTRPSPIGVLIPKVSSVEVQAYFYQLVCWKKYNNSFFLRFYSHDCKITMTQSCFELNSILLMKTHLSTSENITCDSIESFVSKSNLTYS